jgi:hypothetical protein
MQDYLNEEEDEDKGPYASDERVADEVQDLSGEDQETSDDDFSDETEEGFETPEEVVSDSPAEIEAQHDEVVEPSAEEASAEAPQQGFRVMSFEDFISK